jgi:hypothetical protein
MHTPKEPSKKVCQQSAHTNWSGARIEAGGMELWATASGRGTMLVSSVDEGGGSVGGTSMPEAS